MAAVKTNLKIARDLIGKKDFQGAYNAANQVLEYDPSNYNGLVFLGLASLELGKLQQCEEAYRSAIRQAENQVLAWQGIAKLYERARRWKDYGEVLFKLADLFSQSGDAIKCAESLSKYIELQRQHGGRREGSFRFIQLLDALALLLDSSPYYKILSNLPEPDATAPTANSAAAIQVAIYNSLPTLKEMIAITEEIEDEAIKQEVQKRRTRIDAPPLEQLKIQVKREVWSASKLEGLYTEVLNHPNTDDTLRRSTEASLLERKRDKLWTTPEDDPEKVVICKDVQDMVNGMVLLRIPNVQAWSLYFELLDLETLRGYKLSDIRTLLSVLPESPIARLWKAWMKFEHIPQTDEEEESIEEGEMEEALEAALAGHHLLDEFASHSSQDLLPDLPESSLLRRIIAYFYWTLQDFENAVKLSEASLHALATIEKGVGVHLARNSKAINVILASSLVHLYPPKYHARALRSLDALIEEDPNQLECRMARGYIHEHVQRWKEAKQDFDQVLALCDSGTPKWLEAAEESAWSQIQAGEQKEGIHLLETVADLLEPLPDQETALARVWWRLGRAMWVDGDETTYLQAYQLWIAALKRSTAFAPAYTSLGIYYSDYARPPDSTRASKCFQKAFELDPREAEAARRLAEGFVKEQEWELAEIVAKRTIEGEGGAGDASNATTNGLDSRHKPTNVWAWKVLGLVALSRGDQPRAIEAFQVALRSHKDDALTWLRLGEAYAAAGRFTAGLRAMERSRQIQPDTRQCQYQIAEVTRELGDYEAAISLLDTLIDSEPSDTVSHFSRCTARLSLSRHQRIRGFLERAFISCTDVITEAIETLSMGGSSTRALWKLVSDAIFELARSPLDGENIDGVARSVLTKVVEEISQHISQLDARIVSISGVEDIATCLTPDNTWDSIAARLAVAVSGYCITLAGNDDMAQAACCYDVTVRLLELAIRNRQEHQGSLQVIMDTTIDYAKRAIRLQPHEPLYWNSLGIATLESNPKLSQHAFIRALQCEPKNPLLWCNLGFLYMKHLDPQLAQEAFHRAQILDPDYAISWVGQAMLANSKGDTASSISLLGHAVSLSADLPAPNLEFASRTFDSLRRKNLERQSDVAIAAFFALERSLQRCPKDVAALHLAALISERLGLMVRAATFARRSSSLLEAAYERSEDAATARQYAITQSTLGRILLAEGDYTDAISSFETVLNLTDLEPDISDPQAESVRLRIQSHLGIGLASLLAGDAETAVSSLESGLEEAPAAMQTMRMQLTVLLAQTMWVLGTDDTREAAKSILLENIESDPKNLAATVVLGAISTLLNDNVLLEATLSEIVSLSPQERRQLDRLRQVDALLLRHHLMQGSITDALRIAQQAVEMDPGNENCKLRLSELLLRQSQPTALLDVLKADSAHIPTLSAQLRLAAIARSMTSQDDTRTCSIMMQQAVCLAPWEVGNWIGLAYARTKTVQSSG